MPTTPPPLSSDRLGPPPERPGPAFGRSTSVEERMRHIVHASALLFEERGFHGTSMADIANAVGVTKASLYHYVSNKQELLNEIHDAYLDTMLERTEEFVAANPDPLEQLHFFISDIFAVICEYRPYVRAFFQEFNVLEKQYYEKLLPKRERYEQLVEQCLQRGLETGAFSFSVPARVASLHFFGACNWAYQWLDPDRKQEIPQLVDQWYQLTLRGLGGPAD